MVRVFRIIPRQWLSNDEWLPTPIHAKPIFRCGGTDKSRCRESAAGRPATDRSSHFKNSDFLMSPLPRESESEPVVEQSSVINRSNSTLLLQDKKKQESKKQETDNFCIKFLT
jgi:hypothetical protein